MKKHNSIYAIKSFGLKVDDFDEGSRKVKAYASAFDVKDSDSDIIRKGAFSKSIAERGPNSGSNRNIAHLRQHDWNQQIGKILEISEDEKGLMFVSQIGTSTKGEDALRDYQDGILNEHSIGFRYVDDGIEHKEEEGYWEITEVNLFEVSGVTFGANEFTPVIDVAKGLEGNKDTFQKLQSEMSKIAYAIKNGKGTDNRLYTLEMRLIALQQKYQTFFSTLGPSVRDARTRKKEDKPQENEFLREFLLKSLTT